MWFFFPINIVSSINLDCSQHCRCSSGLLHSYISSGKGQAINLQSMNYSLDVCIIIHLAWFIAWSTCDIHFLSVHKSHITLLNVSSPPARCNIHVNSNAWKLVIFIYALRLLIDMQNHSEGDCSKRYCIRNICYQMSRQTALEWRLWCSSLYSISIWLSVAAMNVERNPRMSQGQAPVRLNGGDNAADDGTTLGRLIRFVSSFHVFMPCRPSCLTVNLLVNFWHQLVTTPWHSVVTTWCGIRERLMLISRRRMGMGMAVVIYCLGPR